jgi:benzoyl-CoA 2,3-dioxygenase component B
MLTEEAHHMFVGDTGIQRVVQRTVEVMRELHTEDPEAVRRAGAIDLPTIQRYLNFWFSSSLDLFGADSSSNAAAYFASGLKGRPDEEKFADHVARDATYDLVVPGAAGGVQTESIPYRNALNEVVRNAYVEDCAKGVARWNRWIERAGFATRLFLPSTRFRRTIGNWANVPTDPAGLPISQAQYDAQIASWLPSDADRAFIASLMVRVIEPGKMAGWIAPPEKGIKDRSIDYDYVRLA